MKSKLPECQGAFPNVPYTYDQTGDEVLARQTNGLINGRNAKYTNVKGQRSAFHCHSVKCIFDAKRIIFSTCIVQSARTSKLSALHFEKSDRGDSLRKVDCGRPISNRPRRLKYTRNVCYTDKLISVFFFFLNLSQHLPISVCLKGLRAPPKPPQICLGTLRAYSKPPG